MGGIFKIAELEARKRALITQSEIHREELKAELENLAQYSTGIFQKVDRVRRAGSWVMIAAPFVLPLFGLVLGKRPRTPRPSGWKKGISTALVGLRLYRKYGPLIKSFVGRLQTRQGSGDRTRANIF